MQYDIDPIKFANLITSESNWNTSKISSTGDYGLLQINPRWHPEVASTTILDPIESMEWAAQRIKDGHEAEWTVCNCVSFVKAVSQVKEWEKGLPTVGGKVTFDYNGVYHEAYILSLGEKDFTVREANYEPCLTAKRVVLYSDRHITSFYTAVSIPPN